MAAPPTTAPASMTGPQTPATMTGPPTTAPAATTAAARTFASVLNASPSPALSTKSFTALDELSLGKIGQFKGEKALFLTREEFSDFPSSLSHALVGTFKRGRPRLEDIRKSFPTIGLKGTFHVAHYDHNHIIVRLQHEEDFLRLLIKDTWYIAGFPLFFSKWHPGFDFTKDSSLVPIWVNFERLPLSMFGKKHLFAVSSLIGRPLKVDEATAALTRPSVAKVCIEVDIAAPLPHRIWIGVEDGGFWQSVQYEDLPLYFSDCSRLGHATGDCKKAANPTKPAAAAKNSQFGKPTPNPKTTAATEQPPIVLPTKTAAVSGPDHQALAKSVPDQIDSPSALQQVTEQPSHQPLSIPAPIPDRILQQSIPISNRNSQQPPTAASSSVPAWKSIQQSLMSQKKPLGQPSHPRGPIRILSRTDQPSQSTDVSTAKKSHLGFPHPLVHDLFLPTKLVTDPSHS